MPRPAPEACARALAAAVALLLSTACAERATPEARGGQGQFLFRVEARSVDREAHVRVVLRFGGERRFQLAAADLVGRTVWTFAVAEDRFLWVDHRQRRYCRGKASDALVLPLLRLELSPSAVPRILLGRLPVPVPPESRPDSSGRIRFSDGFGRSWAVEFDPGGRLREWRMTEASGAPVASWQREGADAELVLPQRDLVVRWRQASSEPLPLAWTPFSTPAGFEECACDLVELP